MSEAGWNITLIRNCTQRSTQHVVGVAGDDYRMWWLAVVVGGGNERGKNRLPCDHLQNLLTLLLTLSRQRPSRVIARHGKQLFCLMALAG